MNEALVILSGGQDSTTCLFMAKHQYGFDNVRAVSFDYGQRHVAEIRSAERVAVLAGVTCHDIIRIPGNVLRSTSPLMSATPLEQYENAKQMASVIGSRIEKTFVPMRNLMFLTIAMNLAVHYGIKDLVTGVCQEDNANYPDCTDRFIQLATGVFRASLADNRIRIMAPLMHCSKAQTVKIAYAMPDCWKALQYTHTGYDGAYPPTDMNHANVLRAAGFEEAGYPDPLVERAWRDGLMPLPLSANYDSLRS